ncbi:MAG: PorV/PorQ family protein [Flavobacteriia bacterium]|nr:PorV/PorQ family protein [Flavobacteriia bacterium]
MNKILINFSLVGSILIGTIGFAGNEDRVGSAGAQQLLINPWARTTGTASAGFANATGLEASYLNMGGLTTCDKTQIKFNMTNWLGNAEIKFFAAGLAQRLSESSVIAVSIQSMNFGDIQRTTVENPEGGIGFFSPRLNVFNVGYAKKFSNSISGGINFKVISEAIADLKATGMAVDAGIKYVTGDKEQFKLGISLKNVGPTMKYKGDGLAYQATYVETGSIASLEQRSQSFEMPSLLNIGASYDFILNEMSKLTAIFGFTANSFFSDQYRLAFDYALVKEKIALNIRLGYVYEKNIFSTENRTNALIGPTAGFSLDFLTGKNKNPLGIEYGMRMAGPFGFVHTFGVAVGLK